MYSSLNGRYAFGVAIFVSILMAGYLIATFSVHVFLHLIYYQLSHYIRLLRFQLNTVSDYVDVSNVGHLISIRPRISTKYELYRFSKRCVIWFWFRLQERITRSRRLFGYICCEAAKWNNVFSFMLLFVVAISLITAAFSLFGFIQGFYMKEILFSGVHWLLLFFFLSGCLTLLIIFWATDGPVQEVLSHVI